MHAFARHAKKVRDSAAKISQHALAGDFFLFPQHVRLAAAPVDSHLAVLGIDEPHKGNALAEKLRHATF